jgi:hypothetical protein
VNFVKAGDDDLAQVEAFQRAIRAAWEAYSSLPLHVRRNNGIDWIAFAKIVRQATGAPIAHGQRAVRSDAVDTMRRNIADAEKLSAQAISADRPAKVALVDHARSAWRDFTGTEPPVKPSAGSPFLEFVADLIVAAGKDWGAEKALAAWRTASG